MPNPVVHFEIGSRDLKACKDFYSKVFDWKIEDKGHATIVQKEEGGIGGHLNSLGHEPHTYILFYVQVEDINASLGKITALGGKTVVPKQDLPFGSFAWFTDPQGNTLGLFTPKAKA
jgi:uncharacterized protein